MSLFINHNLMAANAARNLSNVYGNLATSVQRLSSGLRINSAADDAAGLAVREMMRADIAALNQGVRNASDAISMIQTAEGAMSVIDEKLIRMKELAEQAATGTYTTAQRLIMDSEYQAMAAEIDRIASATDFNGIKLLDGSLLTQHDGSGLKVHFGTGNESAEDYYYVSIGDMKATSITGLQVGGGGQSTVIPGSGSVWRTTGLNLAFSTTEIASLGTFGIQTSTDGTTWDIYGFTELNWDPLQDVVDRINAGNVASNTVTFSASATTTSMNSAVIDIDGTFYEFDSTSGIVASVGSTITIGTLGLAGIEEIASLFRDAINNLAQPASGLDQFATIDAASDPLTVNLWAYNGGASAKTISSTSGEVTLGGATFSGGGTRNNITAAAVMDEDGSGYELQITSEPGVHVRVIQPDGTVFGASAATAGGAPSSVTDSSVQLLGIGGGPIQEVSFMDETSEWFSLAPTASSIVGSSWDGANILTQSAAQAALAQIDAAINRKDTARAALGATQNRLENTITNLQIQAENLQAAESRISDVDVALEMTEFTRNNILTQAAVSMLAQANSLPNLALSLLGG